MKTPLVIVSVLTIVAILMGMAIAQAGMTGSGMGSGQMPMTPEFAARMMNACIGAMEGMAPMGRMMGTMGGMMGGQGGMSQMPSEQKP